ncbi:MAG: hypothetical protein ACRDTC_11710 [Pseudonocardiaceae bacterium]
MSTGTRLRMGADWLSPAVAAVVQRIATTPVPPAPAQPRQPNKSRRRTVVLAAVFVVVAAVTGITTAALSGAFQHTGAGSVGPGPSSTDGDPPELAMRRLGRQIPPIPPDRPQPAGDVIPADDF